MTSSFSILSLGDSYTIGEGLPLHLSFPVQLVQLIRKTDHVIAAPEILAKTGWTTGELLEATGGYQFNRPYGFVTLLAGVNNQYRGQKQADYKADMRRLLEIAIGLADNQAERVLVISIPDWGYTPFARDKNRGEITAAIDGFNVVARDLADSFGASFLDITPASREVPEHPDWLAADGLHYAAVVYENWVKKIYPFIINNL